MKRLFILLFSVTLVAEENPYSPITTRNAFELTEALPPASEILNKIETSKIELFLTGVTRWRGETKAHLYSKDLPNKYLSLKAGEQSGPIKVLTVSRDAVKVVNDGTEQVLTFASNSLKTTVLSVKGKPTVVKKDSKEGSRSSRDRESKKSVPSAPRPSIVKVPSRNRTTDPRMQQMMERGLEYINKIEDPEKRNAMLERIEKYQRGDYNKQIEEYRKSRQRNK